MQPDSQRIVAELMAGLCLDLIRRDRVLGVFAEDLPTLDLPTFLKRLSEGFDRTIRVAILGGGKITAKVPAKVALTCNPTEANRWRNDREAGAGTPCITLVVGSAPKLNSLRSAVPLIGQEELRAKLVDRAISLLDTPERRAFWRAIGASTSNFPLSWLLQYLARLEGSAGSQAALLEEEPKLVFLLGLLRQEGRLSSKGQRNASQLLRKNRDLVEKLRNLGKNERKKVVSASEDQSKDRDEARDTAQAILRFERNGEREELAALTYDGVQALLKSKPRVGPEDDAKPRPKERIGGDALAICLLLEEGGQGIKAAAREFRDVTGHDPEAERGPEEIKVGDRHIIRKLRSGTAQAVGLFGRLLSEADWGGMVIAEEASDFVSALKLVASDDAHVIPFQPASRDNVRWMLGRALDQGLIENSVVAKWDAYSDARRAVLPYVTQLIDHPLLELSNDEKLRKAVEQLLELYVGALSAIREAAESLRRAGSVDPAKRLMARALSLDLVFVRSAQEMDAIAAPTHPFHLWRWTDLHSLATRYAKELSEIGVDVIEDLVNEPPTSNPNLLLSPFVAEASVDRPHVFVCNGSFAALPLFGEPKARNLDIQSGRSLAKIAERLIRLLPHAAFGLKIALVDPPTIAGTIDDLLDLSSPFAEDRGVPLHVTVVRTRPAPDETDEEDDELENIVRTLKEGGGSIAILAGEKNLKQVAGHLKEHPAHVVAMFEPGEGQELRVGVVYPPVLSPLVISRAYVYDSFDDRLDVVVAGERAPFSNYYAMFSEAIDLPRSDFVGRRSGASRRSRELADLTEHCLWMVVIDLALEPTLRIGDALRIDWRSEGNRDIATFSTHPETVQELVVDAIRLAGLIPNEPTVKMVFEQICLHSGEALLNLAKPGADGSLVDVRIAKGMIGVLAAARWYNRMNPDSVLISLDEPRSRRWILGAIEADNRRGDLFAVHNSPQGVVMEVIEVKAHDELEGVLSVRGGRAEGKAATQVDQTIKTLKKILAATPGSGIDYARKEVLRDQLYRAVASRPYTQDQRGRLVGLLGELFGQGPTQVSGLVFRVAIQSGKGETTPSAPERCRTPEDNPLGVVDLIESEFGLNPVIDPKPRTDTSDKERDESLPAQAGRVSSPSPKGNRSGPALDRNEGIVPNPKGGSEGPADLKVLIGNTAAGQPIFWEPHKPDHSLNNFGILITGDSGSGKTQMLRAIIHDVAARNHPVCVFDFKNDYADPSFSEKAFLRVYDVDRDGLPFNPLSLIPDEHGEARPMRQIHEIVGILRRIYNLGAQQEARLKKAVITAFEDCGIQVASRHKGEDLQAEPSFDNVIAILQRDSKNEGLLNRLSPLFDLGLFPDSKSVKTTFERLLGERIVMDLHKLPKDDIKAAVAELIIVRLHGYVVRGEQPRQFRRLLVFDEAWRVKDSDRLQELAREGRAFGVGIAIGTQFPKDIPQNLAGNLATQIYLYNKEADHQKVIVRSLCGTGSGQTASQLLSKLAVLKTHEGFFRNQQYSPYVFMRAVPHYERVRP